MSNVNEIFSYWGGVKMANNNFLVNEEFIQIVDEFNNFYIDSLDYYRSINESITIDMMRDYIEQDGIVTESSIMNTVKNVVKKIIDFISTTWNKFTGIFKKGTDTTTKNCERAIKDLEEKKEEAKEPGRSERRSSSVSSSTSDNDSTFRGSESSDRYEITGRDYIMMVKKPSSNYNQLQELCIGAVAYTGMIGKSVQHSIEELLRSGYAFNSKTVNTDEKLKELKSFYGGSTSAIKSKFKVKKVSEITNDVIIRYILDGVEEKTFNISLNTAIDNLNIIAREIKYLTDFKNKCSSKLNELLRTLNDIYKSVKKDKNELDKYKTNDYYRYDEDNTKKQSIILDYLRSLQKDVNDVLYFTTRAMTCKLNVLNRATTLYGSI